MVSQPDLPRSGPDTIQASRAMPLLKVRDVAALLGVAPITVRRRVQGNTLPHFRISGQLYFRMNEVNAFIEASRGASCDQLA